MRDFSSRRFETALLTLAAISAACGSASSGTQANTQPSSQRSPTPTTERSGASRPTPSNSVEPCGVAQLKIAANDEREGFDASSVQLTLSDIGGAGCILRGLPRIAPLTRNGERLVAHDEIHHGTPVVLHPQARNTAVVAMSWMNWCGGNNNPRQVSIRVYRGKDSMTVELADSARRLAPRCGNPGQKSTLRLLNAYVGSGVDG
jgi:hypothetical protein